MSELAVGSSGASQPSPAPSALEVVADYHERTKHQLGRYAPGPETLDWDAQPSPFRHFEGADAVSLPRLCDATGQLRRALERAPSETLETGPLAFSLDSVGALLALAFGITAWKRQGPDRWAVRANPSSGNLHPVEVYALVSGAEFLASGVYHYRAEAHALEERALWSPDAALPGPRVWLALTTIMWREAWKYGERAFRYCQLDTGHAVAALRYAAGILGWRVREQPNVGSVALAHALGLNRTEDLSPSRRTYTELEEPELLLELEPDPTYPTLRGEDLLRWSTSARFSGRASLIDAHPMYFWPVVQQVAAATQRPDLPPIAPESLAPKAAIRSRLAKASAASLVLGRRSAQRFDRDFELSKAAFVELLSGVASAAGPSARLALALFVHRVEGLAPGVYLLALATPAPDSRLFERLARQFPIEQVPDFDELGSFWRLATVPPRELARIARTLHCNQDIASSCCFALGMLADLEQTLEQPSDYRSLLREAGGLGHSLYLQAEAAGVRGTGIGCFFDDAVADFLTLRDSPFRSVYHFSIGRPLEDARIETVPEPRLPEPEPAMPPMTDTLRLFLQTHGFDARDLDAPAQHGLTPLMRAALSGELDLVDELLRAGAKVEHQNDDGNNALWLACVSRRPEVVRRLVAAGIDLDNRNLVGATALMYASSSGKADMVALLLELGANAAITNQDGANAGDMAATLDCLKLLRHTVH